MESFRFWVQEHFTPVVLVACTPAAEAICTSKNGLGVVDILRPFSQIPRLDASVRIGEASVRVAELKLRFHAASTMYQPKPEAAEEHLRDVLQAAAQKYINKDAAGPALLGMVQAGKTPPAPSPAELGPWFIEYQEELLRIVGWGEHEAFDHPVAALLVAPADVANPVSHFEALLNQMVPPPLMQQEVMYPVKDREFPKHYVLLHDGSASIVDDRKAAENLAACQRAFGQPHCSLIKINTAGGSTATQGATPDFFKKFMKAGLAGGGAGEPETRPPPPPQGLGACLSVSDLDAVAAALREFATRTLLPKVEERCAKLNAGITATRRGLRNRITRLWKGGASEETASDKPYPWHSIESQMRQLADLAFVLHAYDFAAATYRLASQDYTAASANRWYAGAQEMLGLSVLLSYDDDNDPFKYFSRAAEHYARLPPGRTSRMLSTRCALLASGYLSAAKRYATASAVLMRAHFEEENARAALLLEQSAYCLLYCQPPSARKFAFQNVLAGLRYHAAGQKKLATHAYRQVLGAYTGKRWRAIEEHLHDVLGKQCWDAHDEALAAEHFMALLQDCGQGRPQALQSHYLTLFMEAVKRMSNKDGGRSGPLKDLRLPVIGLKDPLVSFAGVSHAGNAQAASVPDAAWSRLEACVSESAGAGGTNWLDGGMNGGASKQQTKDHEEFNTVVAGEQVAIAVQFKNPLAIKLRLSAVRLLVEFTPSGDPVDGGSSGLATIAVSTAPVALSDRDQHSGSGEEPELHPLAAGTGPPTLAQRQRVESVDVDDVRFALHPGESITETLRVTARAPGWLRVTGVGWVVNEAVEGAAPFDVRGRKRKHPKGTRLGQLKHFPPHRRLLFSVLPSAPRLELVAESLPRHMYTGEIVRCVVSIRNVGNVACRNLQLVMGHPEVAATTACTITSASGKLLAGDPAPAGQTAAELLWGGSESVLTSRIPASAQGKGASLFKPPWPSSTELPPGGRLDWPVWLHPRGSGTLRLQMVVYYEPVAAASAPGAGQAPLRYRTMRLAQVTQVAPVLVARPSISAAGLQDLGSQLLRLDMEVAKDTQTLSVRQLTCATRGTDAGWRMVAGASLSGNGAAQAPGAPSTLELTHTLQPGIQLQPGESTTATYVLQPPLSTQQAIGTAGSLPSTPTATQPVDLLSALSAGGALSHCYGMPLRSLTSAPGSHAASSARLAEASHTSLQGLGSSLAGPANGAAAMHADPPVDLFIVWQCPRRTDGLSSTSTDAAGNLPAEHWGITRLADLTSTAKPPLQPVRIALRVAPIAASGSSGGAVLRHDFRHAPMCIVPLRLVARNCSGGDARLAVEAGDSWQAPASAHAWQVAAPGQAPAAAAAVAAAASQAPSAQSSRAGSPERMAGVQLQPVGPRAAQAPVPALTFAAGLEPSMDYVWCGKTCVNMASLQPGADVEVPLQVAVFKPGTYAVVGCRVSYSVESAAMSVSETQRVEQLLVRVDAA